MSEINHPVLETKKIVLATVVALLIAVIVLIFAVLPAEYGIDPTGVGNLLGLNILHKPGEIKEAVIKEETDIQNSHRLLKLENGGSGPDVAIPSEANNPPPSKQFAEREDSIQLSIPAGEDIEYKINILKYGRIKYEWITNQGTAFFDFHGEVKQVNPSGNVYYESYTVSYSHNMIGSFLSPFEGKHGWYFKNNSKKNMTIKIRLKGQYELMK